MSEPRANLTQLEELACDAALFGLSETELAELRQRSFGGTADEATLAADVETLAAELATAVPRLELPTRLRERLLADVSVAFAPPPPRRSPAPDTAPRAHRPSRWPAFVAGAVLAAAAAVLFVLTSPRPAPAPEPVASTSAARAALLTAAGTITWQFGATGDRAGVGASGDVVWNADRQEGYMRIVGLSVNDVTVEQYQLWIFDATQDERYPIDGGVFDIGAATPGANGETIVPIAAKLSVREPKLFAVTVEKPGGVVVSGREHIVALASL